MRTLSLSAVTALVFGVVLLLRAEREDDAKPVEVTLRLVEKATGKNVVGMIRVVPSGQDAALSLKNLYNRMEGLKNAPVQQGWHIVPAGGVKTMLPRAALQFEAVSGLESGAARLDADLGKDSTTEIVVPLPTVFRPEMHHLFAGNTHLHLRNMKRAEADEYLRHIPAADRLRVMFISYLERDKDDLTYITNEYPVGALKGFDATGVLFNNGEEHRHNFGGYGQGYGHVMFLDIKNLVKPVSLGPGITGGGNDDTPLRPGIDDARKQGGTVIWCHNGNGFEDVLSALTRRLDALNVFDGSRTGNFEDLYYRLLNIGLRLPISTGTDWFMYDMSRVYAKVDGELSVKSWLAAVKAGRCQATNGPLLTLTVDGKEIGDMLKLEKGRKLRVEAYASGRHDFGKLELIHNGKVIHTANAASKDGGFKGQFTREVTVEEPGWFALRIDATSKNEFGTRPFAHTSPVYVDLAGKRRFDVESAQSLLRQIDEGATEIRAKGLFSDEKAKARLLDLYDQAAKDLKERINQRGS